MLLAIIGEQWAGFGSGRDERRIDDPRDFVRIETESALRRGIPVIPVLVRGATMPTEDELPQPLKTLAYRNAIRIRPDPDFHRDVDRLIEGLKAHLKK